MGTFFAIILLLLVWALIGVASAAVADVFDKWPTTSPGWRIFVWAGLPLWLTLMIKDDDPFAPDLKYIFTWLLTGQDPKDQFADE